MLFRSDSGAHSRSKGAGASRTMQTSLYHFAARCGVGRHWQGCRPTPNSRRLKAASVKVPRMRCRRVEARRGRGVSWCSVSRLDRRIAEAKGDTAGAIKAFHHGVPRRIGSAITNPRLA